MRILYPKLSWTLGNWKEGLASLEISQGLAKKLKVSAPLDSPHFVKLPKAGYTLKNRLFGSQFALDT
jgi:hypothetical protein